MEKLKGYQKKYLRGIAHGAKPLVFIGQNGITPNLVKAIDESLDQHEIIKVKFIEFKEKEKKKELAADIEKETGAEFVGMIGHIAIFFRRHKDPEKRSVELPSR